MVLVLVMVNWYGCSAKLQQVSLEFAWSWRGASIRLRHFTLYGLAAVLPHCWEVKSTRPKYCNCQSFPFNPAEHKCAQVDKEGLASVYGVAKFYQYLIDCKFIIKSDNKLASPTHVWWIKAHNIIYQQWHLLTCNIRNWHSTHMTTPSRHVCPHRLPQLIYSPITILHSLSVSSRKSSRRMEFTIWHIAVGPAWIAGSVW